MNARRIAVAATSARRDHVPFPHPRASWNRRFDGLEADQQSIVRFKGEHRPVDDSPAEVHDSIGWC
jgi:hypothetical protein